MNLEIIKNNNEYFYKIPIDLLENYRLNNFLSIKDTGRGIFLNNNPERDIEIRYKNTDYVLTIRKMEE